MLNDFSEFTVLAHKVCQWAAAFNQRLPDMSVADMTDPVPLPRSVPESGRGFNEAFNTFKELIAPHLSGSAGPRYWGFVTGGTTTAAQLADWLVSTIDQNVGSSGDSIASAIEQQTMEWLLEMVDLPNTFTGILTTGATASNMLGLTCGRQFAGYQQGIDIAEEGLSGSDIEVFSATPHASTLKCMAMVGLGRKAWRPVACLKDSEAMDVSDLERQLAASSSPGKIVVASAGTVTGNDFDNLALIADLCQQHKAWLHVDAAFGLFARLLSEKKAWSHGLENADSITSDAHKWLNVPYDCGIFFTRHSQVLRESCAADAAYLKTESKIPSFMNLGIENSRRFRALPLWMSLEAYGIDGIRDIVRANCGQAEQFANWLQSSEDFTLLKPARMNVVVFKPTKLEGSDVTRFLKQLNQTGEVYLTPGEWLGQAAIRAAFSNWQTRAEDVDRVCQLLQNLVRS
ncbi:pyridoxal phosphate-dependent decarboxylase family protein [Hahella ganghwensis]|uniref:pyridoxal phosphate-dependent decarboxylase family protein n=1 Tax=Hahella ganghwensis TaxID=286420 RepID=UPI000373566A|nr:aminotransferase class I/II-fold pyridoxal phosphate-dependent enzyme [Hahella ganghwensis]